MQRQSSPDMRSDACTPEVTHTCSSAAIWETTVASLSAAKGLTNTRARQSGRGGPDMPSTDSSNLN